MKINSFQQKHSLDIGICICTNNQVKGKIERTSRKTDAKTVQNKVNQNHKG